MLSAPSLALMTGGTAFAIVLLMFIGATGKSAQIPLFVWLPDAMAGPTPVSALIHAATMVTSGLYLLARMSPLVLQAPTVMAIIATVGALTAIMAATVAITQNDIKKVLAYSTVSQLGYMFLATGVGAFYVAIFHVMTHAFFKACLFLGSGSVIHAMHHIEHDLEHKGLIPSSHGHGHDSADTPLDSEAHQNPLRTNPLPYDGPFDAQDMRTMGGLKKGMPLTRITFLVSTLAIAGIAPLSGFFSKDEILFRTFIAGTSPEGHIGYMVLWAVGLITALLTAVYMTRAYLLTFEGESRWPGAHSVHAHESPWTMTLPLVVLAVLAAVGGFLGLPAVLGPSWLHGWLVGHGEHIGPVRDFMFNHELSHATEWALLALGLGVAVAGVAGAWLVLGFGRRGPVVDAKVKRALGPIYTAASKKWGWDEAYDAAIVTPIVEGSRRGLAPFDKSVVDGGVNGLGRGFRLASLGMKRLQTGLVQQYALALVLGVVFVVAVILFG